MTERIRLEVDGPIATVRLDHPPHNAFDTAMRVALEDVAAQLTESPEIAAVVLWGGEKTFAAGADIRALQQMSFETVLGWNHAMQRAIGRFAELSVPTVAAVNGYALGGGTELALCADFRIIGESATLGQPEVLLGIMPGSGGTQRLSRLVGTSVAKELLMTGRQVTAAEARAIGLVNRVVPDEDVYAEALALARTLADGPRFALRAIKEAVDHGVDGSLTAGLALERGLFAGLYATGDRVAGLDSFLANGPGQARFGRGDPDA